MSRNQGRHLVDHFGGVGTAKTGEGEGTQTVGQLSYYQRYHWKCCIVWGGANKAAPRTGKGKRSLV